MQIRVKLYASLRRFAPGGGAGSPFEVNLPEGAKIQDLVERLEIPIEESRVAFVNGLTKELDWGLQPGDEVGLFPPVGGG